MPAAFGNEELERMIASDAAIMDHVNDPELRELRTWLLESDDAMSVEAARLAIHNLALRHAGFYDTGESMSMEGMYHSAKRVLKLMGDALKESSGY